MMKPKEIRRLLLSAAASDSRLKRRITAHIEAHRTGSDAYAAEVSDALDEIVDAKRSARADWWYEDFRYRDDEPDYSRVEELLGEALCVIEGIGDRSSVKTRLTALEAVIEMLDKRPRRRDGSMWAEEAQLLAVAKGLLSSKGLLTDPKEETWIDELEEELGGEENLRVDLRSMRFYDWGGAEVGVNFSPHGPLSSLEDEIMDYLSAYDAPVTYAAIVRDFKRDPLKLAKALLRLNLLEEIQQCRVGSKIAWAAY